jgi:hypothetical protein
MYRSVLASSDSLPAQHVPCEVHSAVPLSSHLEGGQENLEIPSRNTGIGMLGRLAQPPELNTSRATDTNMDVEWDWPNEVEAQFDDPAAAHSGMNEHSLEIPSRNAMFCCLVFPIKLTTLCCTDRNIDVEWDQPNEVDAEIGDPAAAPSGVDKDTAHDDLEKFQGNGVEEYWDGCGEDEMNEEEIELEFGGVADDDEGDGSHVNDGIFTDKIGEPNGNPMRRGGPGKARSTMPTWLRENYNDTCEQLRNEMHRNASKRPSCYDAGQFIMYPPAPVFTSHRHQLLPKLFYQPHYFVWLPHLFHRIPCPSCKDAGRKKDGGPVFLRVKGWPRMPRRVFDIEYNIFIIGQRYVCGDNNCRRTYQSWASSILNIIPPPLAAHFTHQLTFRSGLTDRLAALLRSCFQRGQGPSPFTNMIRMFHIRRYEQLYVQYLEMAKTRRSAVAAKLLPLHHHFGTWADVNGYADAVPSHTYFRGFYDTFIEKHASEMDQHMAMLPARILCNDHSFKVRISSCSFTSMNTLYCRFRIISVKLMAALFSAHLIPLSMKPEKFVQ